MAVSKKTSLIKGDSKKTTPKMDAKAAQSASHSSKEKSKSLDRPKKSAAAATEVGKIKKSPADKSAVKPTSKSVPGSTKAPEHKAPASKSSEVMKMATPAAPHRVSSISKAADFTGIGYLGIPPYQEKSGEEYMNDKQLLHFQQILEAWKVSLMEEVDRTVNHMKDDAANFPDLNDRASQEEEFSLELRTRDRERKLIKKIDEALDRVLRHDYGYCDVCGIEIGIRRLEARPTATLCIDCKTLDEIREKQLRGG